MALVIYEGNSLSTYDCEFRYKRGLRQDEIRLLQVEKALS